MEKLSVSIYRNAEFNCDCTNNGVSSRHDRMILFWGCKKEEAVNYCEKNGIGKETALWLNPRILWGCDHFFAEPLEKPKNVVGPMFGGNFCYTSDSRLYRFGGDYHLPIPIHDRFETEKDYGSYD